MRFDQQQTFLSLTIACSSGVRTSAATTASAWAWSWGRGACWQRGRLVKAVVLHSACKRVSCY